MKKLAFVFPVFNGEVYLNNLFEKFLEISQKIENTFNIKSSLIIVDDGSKDKTFVKAKELFEKKRVEGLFISFTRNFGKDKAILSALENFEADYYVILDVDLQTPIEIVPQMLQKLISEDVELVKAVKINEPYGILRKLFTKLFFMVAGFLKISEFKKGSSDFILFTKNVRDNVISLKENEFLLRTMIFWFGFKDSEIYFEPEKVKDTRFPFSKLFSIGIRGIVTFSNFLRINFLFSVIYWIAAFFYAGLIIYNKIHHKIVTGLSSTLLLMLMSFGLLFLMLAIIGEILKIIFEEVKKRPRYIIREKLEYKK